MPLPHTGPPGNVVVVEVVGGGAVVVGVVVVVDGGSVGWVVLVEVDVVEVVVVVVPAQPPFGSQASQQLATWLTHLEPPLGARQASAFRLIEHFFRPLAVVRQHATASDRPHVDFEAQRRSAPAQPGASRPCTTATWATAIAHRK
jgi:hypothetical protein